MASSKRQTTMAKLTRERKVQEKREMKRAKKEARKAGLDPAAEETGAEDVAAVDGDEQPLDDAPDPALAPPRAE